MILIKPLFFLYIKVILTINLVIVKKNNKSCRLCHSSILQVSAYIKVLINYKKKILNNHDKQSIN